MVASAVSLREITKAQLPETSPLNSSSLLEKQRSKLISFKHILYLLTWSALNQILRERTATWHRRISSPTKFLTEAETYSLCSVYSRGESSDVASGWLRSCGFAWVCSRRLKNIRTSSQLPQVSQWVVVAWRRCRTPSPPRGRPGSLTTRPHSQCSTCTQQTSSSRPGETDFPNTELSLWTIQQKFSFQLWVGDSCCKCWC